MTDIEVYAICEHYFLSITKSLGKRAFSDSLLVISASPYVINHNLKTVPRIYSSVRPEATYEQSLRLLKNVSLTCPDQRITTKSGPMSGLGETSEEVVEVMKVLLQ